MADAKDKGKQLKLYYFNGRGRGEVSRYLLAEAKIPYEDVRIDGGKDWAAGACYKNKMPFGQVPVLEIPGAAGFKLAESAAVERYIARLGKLYGANELEAAQIDMVVEGIADAARDWITATRIKDESDKKAKLDKYFKEDFPRWAGQLTALLKANNGGSGYFVGSNVSLADIVFFHAFETISGSNPTAIAAFPELAALIKRVAERPNIAAWIKSRPASAW